MLFPFRDDNPTRLTPLVTMALIAMNALVFLYQFTLPEAAQQRFIYAFGMIPAVLLGGAHLPPELAAVPAWATVFSSMSRSRNSAALASLEKSRPLPEMIFFACGPNSSLSAANRINAPALPTGNGAVLMMSSWGMMLGGVGREFDL